VLRPSNSFISQSNQCQSDPASPASFEKALQKLSTQFSSANISLETTRSRARRVKALWTLYTILAYLISAAVLVLVLGPQKWHIPHYIGLVGGPIIIYGVRTLLALFFDWQIGRKQAYVEDLQKQREAKINDLKKATKYDSTQELLQKYGAAPKQTPSKPQQGTKRKIVSPQNQPQRTGLPPPPTANIVRPGGSPPNTPQRQNVPELPISNGVSRGPQSLHPLTTSPVSPYAEEPGFAPNAFVSGMPPPRSSYDKPSNWYDRILDVILGDDETLAKNRLALICSKCRLVNGQAPPGVQTLEQVGVWRCSSCGAKNGVESETKKLVKETTENAGDKDEDWQPTSRAEDSSVSEPVKQLDGATDDTVPREEMKDSDDGETESNLGGVARGVGTGQEADAPGITKRVTRSAKKEYDDEDQGW
jgi:endoplasmic reticulum junction formation protein lunapark